MPYQEEEFTDVQIDFKDQIYQKIYGFQDRLLTDSLIPFLRHSDPNYRYVAALAFGSVKDSAAIDSLAPLLRDRVDEVRAAAAYAIGQMGAAAGEDYLLSAFDQYDTAGVYRKANRAILEAVGKCGSEQTLEHLTTIETYNYRDTALLEGQAWGVYRYALRGMTLARGTALMSNFLRDSLYPDRIRFIAANYFLRANEIDIDSLAVPFSGLLMEEEDPRIRMALAVAVGKTQQDTGLQVLKRQFAREQDYRVQCNILSTLGNFEYSKAQQLALEALKDGNLNVAKRGARFFLEHGVSQDARMYWRRAKDSLPLAVRIGMYAAAQRHMPSYFQEYRNQLNNELRQLFQRSQGPYQKAAALRALAEYGWNYRFIHREGFPHEHPVVRTASVEGLAIISDNPDFRQDFGAGRRTVRRNLADYFQEAIETGDPGMVTVAANALRNPLQNYDRQLNSLSFLQTSLQKLDLPRDIEAYRALEHTIADFNDEAYRPTVPDYNHPIDWDLLERITIDPIALIRTERGVIRLKLLPRVAPATVANFIHLAQSDYFQGKSFHRVVPNFVIQGGCPRGDGYGSLDYTIRSELPHVHYDQGGYVGMASAGNHTESCQFFITHAPTLHLDGNYTLFARVTEGMEYVHRMEVGDVIQEVRIQ